MVQVSARWTQKTQGTERMMSTFSQAAMEVNIYRKYLN